MVILYILMARTMRSPISMEKAILTFQDIYNDRYKVVILGDILELGEGCGISRELEKILRNTKRNEILLYGSLMKNLYEKIKDMNVFILMKNLFLSEKLRT